MPQGIKPALDMAFLQGVITPKLGRRGEPLFGPLSNDATVRKSIGEGNLLATTCRLNPMTQLLLIPDAAFLNPGVGALVNDSRGKFEMRRLTI